jgi:hypothetical protein
MFHITHTLPRLPSYELVAYHRNLRAGCRLQSESDIYVLVIGLQTTGFVTTLEVHTLLEERGILATSARNKPRSYFEYEGGHRAIELRLV